MLWPEEVAAQRALYLASSSPRIGVRARVLLNDVLLLGLGLLLGDLPSFSCEGMWFPLLNVGFNSPSCSVSV